LEAEGKVHLTKGKTVEPFNKSLGKFKTYEGRPLSTPFSKEAGKGDWVNIRRQTKNQNHGLLGDFDRDFHRGQENEGGLVQEKAEKAEEPPLLDLEGNEKMAKGLQTRVVPKYFTRRWVRKKEKKEETSARPETRKKEARQGRGVAKERTSNGQSYFPG